MPKNLLKLTDAAGVMEQKSESVRRWKDEVREETVFGYRDAPFLICIEI